MAEVLKCPIYRHPDLVREKGPCTGGLCLCGKNGIHVLLNDGKVSCGWCRECLLKWFSLPPKET